CARDLGYGIYYFDYW
nr:immunoglobulin heavy chain junction region [Macaca mulatta]MOW21567.1 immunoglobulin heavy chain junction region [Macaca mulatta]